MKQKSYRNSLIFGTVMLLFSNIIVKGIGFFYRVILVRLLGTEGIGLMEMTMPLFSFLLVLSGCGIQTSLSQLIASNGIAKRYGLFSTALIMLVLCSAVMTALSYLFLPWMINSFSADPRISLCFEALLPAIPIIGIASAFRGLLQGAKKVGSLGMSQNAEQIVRVATGILLTGKMTEAGFSLEMKAAAPSLATVCGEAAGAVYLLISFLFLKRKLFPADSENKKFDLRAAGKMLAMGLPLTGSRLVSSGIMMLQALLIPLCLKIGGWDIRGITEIYGRFSGEALSLLHLPGVFTAALTVSVLPAVAESLNSGSSILKERINLSLQTASIFTVLGMLLLFIFADPLCVILFNDRPAAPLLQILAPGGILFYLQLTVSGILQGMGETRTLLTNNIVSGVIIIAGICLLTPIPALGIKGTALAADMSWACGFIINMLSLYKKADISIEWRNIAAKPAIASGTVLCLWAAANMFFPGINENTGYATLLIEGAAISGIYMAILYLCKGMIKIYRG